MIKSASIVRNLSKNHTFRTIASILIYTLPRFPTNSKRPFPRFPANFKQAKPPFPRNLICIIPPFPANLIRGFAVPNQIQPSRSEYTRTIRHIDWKQNTSFLHKSTYFAVLYAKSFHICLMYLIDILDITSVSAVHISKRIVLGRLPAFFIKEKSELR